MTTEKAIKIIANKANNSDLFVCSLGRTAELSFRYINNIDRVLFVDCLGATLGLGVGIALANTNIPVYAFETDGSFFYNMTIFNVMRKCTMQLSNFHPFIFDNGILESAGGLPSASVGFSWEDMAKAWNINLVVVLDEDDLIKYLDNNNMMVPTVIVIKVDNSNMPDYCTKDIDGIESRYRFKRYICNNIQKGIIKPCLKN